MLLTSATNSAVNRIKLLDLGILLEYRRDFVGGRLRRRFQQDQPRLERGSGNRIDDPISARHRRLRRLRGRNYLHRRGTGDRTGCAPTARPRRDQTHIRGHVRPFVRGPRETPQSLYGGLRVRSTGRLAVFVLATRLPLPLRWYRSVHHVGRTQAAGLVGLVLRLFALRHGVLTLRVDGLARLHERSSKYVRASWIVKRVLGAVGQRRGAVEDQCPFV